VVLLVEGYALADEDLDGFVARLHGRVAEGYTALKLEAASEPDFRRVAERLARVRDELGPDVALVVDVAWKWDSVDEAVRACSAWDSYGLAWIEDPMRRDSAEDMAALRRAIKSPLGAGDEATRQADLEALMAAGALDILRVDATTVGGITAARELIAEATERGLTVAPHAHPEVHRHLVHAFRACSHLEAFPVDRPFDCAHQLLEGSPSPTSIGVG
jgi:L-alanine-DL-glutamate epimerase-like enolase superfamily enzyme